MKSKMQKFCTDVARYRQLAALKQRGVIRLGISDDREPLYLDPQVFQTHVMIQAPTGAGKTFLARHLFRSLVQQPERVAIWADDPKQDFYEALEEDCAALGLAERTILWNTSWPEQVCLFDPCHNHGLSSEDLALWILGAIRSSWQQENFAQTPQLLRWLFNSTEPIVEGQGTFPDILELLHYQETVTRKVFVAKTKNQLLRQEWEAYEALSVSRRREETASAYARLLPFCQNPTIRRSMGTKGPSLPLDQVLKQGMILLTCFPRFRPLEPELTTLLRSLLLQSVLAQAFYHPLGTRPRLYIFLDEAEHALEHDTGVIETILNEGRSLGIHLVVMFHTLSQIVKKNPNLLATLLTNCRTKLIGGHLSQADLEVLTSELFIQDWDPYEIKDEIWNCQLMPEESSRQQVNQSAGFSHTDGQEEGESFGLAFSETLSHSEAETIGESQSESWATARGGAHMRGISQGASLGQLEGQGAGELYTSEDELMSSSQHWGSQESNGRFSGHSDAESESWSDIAGSSLSTMHAFTRGLARTLGATQSQSVSRARSHADSRNQGLSVTNVPWYEYRERWYVSSREFIGLQEFLTRKLQQLKGQAKGHWVIQTPEGRPVCFQALFLKPLLFLERERQACVQAFRQAVRGKPWYATPEEIDHKLARRLEDLRREAGVDAPPMRKIRNRS